MSNHKKNKSAKQGHDWEEETDSLLLKQNSSASTKSGNTAETKINDSEQNEQEGKKTIWKTLLKFLIVLTVIYLLWTFVKSSFSKFVMD